MSDTEHEPIEASLEGNAADERSPGGTRMSGHSARQSYRNGGWGMLIFATPFLGIGGWISLWGFEVIPTPPGDINAPLPIIGCVGLVFFGAGLLVLGQGLIGMARAAKMNAIKAARPNEPWMHDFPWREDGVHDNTGRKAVGGFFAAAFMAVFLIPFHWWGFVEGQVCVAIGMVLFDLIVVAVIGNSCYLLFRRMKYGRSFLRFEGFPYRLGETLEASFEPSRGIGTYNSVTFTLRSIQVHRETTRSGNETKSSDVCYLLHEDTFEVSEGGSLAQGGVPVTFLLPPDASLSTAMSDNPPRYWELEIKADTPGVDFGATYLVPVYA